MRDPSHARRLNRMAAILIVLALLAAATIGADRNDYCPPRDDTTPNIRACNPAPTSMSGLEHFALRRGK